MELIYKQISAYFSTVFSPSPPLNELQHDKTNKMTCAPSIDSDQLGHPPSLITVLLCAQRVTKDPSFRHVDSKD